MHIYPKCTFISVNMYITAKNYSQLIQSYKFFNQSQPTL